MLLHGRSRAPPLFDDASLSHEMRLAIGDYSGSGGPIVPLEHRGTVLMS
jgi:hypothetical protein